LTLDVEPFADAEGLVRVYPAREPDGTGLVWAHGGGFAAGSLDMPESDWVAGQISRRGTTVIAVDYRLVGDGCRYPAPSDDVLAAWTWAAENADRLRVDSTRLAIGGASAGANLVTGAVLRMLDAGIRPLPALAVLAYPTLHAVQQAPDAALRALLDADPEADRFQPAAVRAMYENYLGGSIDDADRFAIPGLASAEELAGFPPVLMINDEADELRVSGETFAATLRQAHVDVDVTTEPGTHHGHLNRPHEPAASASIDRIVARLTSLSTPATEGNPS
jgi:acetyl esterase